MLSGPLFFCLCPEKMPGCWNWRQCWGAWGWEDQPDPQPNKNPAAPLLPLLYTGTCKRDFIWKIGSLSERSLKTTYLVQSWALLLEGRLKLTFQVPLGVCRLFPRWALQAPRLSSCLGKTREAAGIGPCAKLDLKREWAALLTLKVLTAQYLDFLLHYVQSKDLLLMYPTSRSLFHAPLNLGATTAALTWANTKTHTTTSNTKRWKRGADGDS